MAQKSKAAAQQPRKSKPLSGKPGGKLSKVKAKTAKEAEGPGAAIAPAVPVAPAVPAVPAAKAKPGVKPASARPAIVKSAAKGAVKPTSQGIGVANPVENKTKKAEPRIEQAKAALKKENVLAATPTSAKPTPGGAKSARARKISIDVNPNEAASALAQKWSTLYKKAELIEAKPYNMKASFEEKTAITHKVLGWGYILANRNDRLEVLFKDGIKYLISNYKP